MRHYRKYALSRRIGISAGNNVSMLCRASARGRPSRSSSAPRSSRTAAARRRVIGGVTPCAGALAHARKSRADTCAMFIAHQRPTSHARQYVGASSSQMSAALFCFKCLSAPRKWLGSNIGLLLSARPKMPPPSIDPSASRNQARQAAVIDMARCRRRFTLLRNEALSACAAGICDNLVTCHAACRRRVCAALTR